MAARLSAKRLPRYGLDSKLRAERPIACPSWDNPTLGTVFLTDGQGKFTLPDGKTQDAPIKAGTAQWDGGGKHLPENVGDKPFELILVELKTKPATAK